MRHTSQWWPIALLAGCALAAAAVPAHAQKPETASKGGAYREGFWIGLGLGYGNAGISCSSCSGNSRYGSGAATIRMGGTLSPNFLMGGELNAWSRQSSGVTETVGDLAAALYWYPQATGGFYLKGGAGAVVYQADVSPKWEITGFGVNVGAGIDLYLSRKFSVTPYVNFLTATGGTLKIGGTDTGFKARPNLIQAGVQAVWH